MEVIAVRCNHCGAPLEIGEQTRFVTCQFCKSQLAVKHSQSAAYTEVIEQIAAQTTQMAGNLKVIELQNELERMDREWVEQRESYYVNEKHGRARPSRGGALIGAIIGIPFLIFWIGMAGKIGAPGFFVLFGLVVLGAIIYNSVTSFSKAGALETAEDEHQRQRQRLLDRLDETRSKAQN